MPLSFIACQTEAFAGQYNVVDGSEVVFSLDTRPIGVFDSGFMGVTVLASAVKELPNEDFILSDNRIAPYGDRTPQQVLDFTRQPFMALAGLALQGDCDFQNRHQRRGRHAAPGDDIPIIGMEPALKPAAQVPGTGNVLVMATSMTGVKSFIS